jgi:phage tail sheath gpL-like
MYVEFDPSRAVSGPSVLTYKALIIGQILSSGTKYDATANAVGPFLVSDSDTVGKMCGFGSQLHRMAIAWFAANKFTQLFIIGLKDASSSKATGSIAFSGTSTASGAVYAYINGTLVPVAVTSGMTADAIGTALASAINAISSLPVTAVNTTGTVAITAKNAGSIGNQIDIRLNYNFGEELAAGITGTITALSSGSVDPSLADAISIMGDEWYNVIVGSYTDNTNQSAMETELTARFGPLQQIDGVYISSRRGTLSDLVTYGDGKNSPHVTIISNGGKTGKGRPSWSPEVASAYAAQIALEGAADPARPLQTLELIGILPEEINERFDSSENNQLLYAGISTTTIDAGGKVRIQRAITQYQKNEVGADSIAYLDVETMLTLMYLRYSFRNTILTKYPRAKLADDGVGVNPGQQIITPKVGKAEAISIFRQWEGMGLVENIGQFKRDIVCRRSTTDPNRLEWILPPDLVNQFRVGAASIQFILG